jgi:hypothetical protein
MRYSDAKNRVRKSGKERKDIVSTGVFSPNKIHKSEKLV